MKIGVMLPYLDDTMTRDEFVNWCEVVDEGPFSTLAAGERIVFSNFDQMSILAAAAVQTRRVKVLTLVAVLPLHASAQFAKTTASIDRLSGGRLSLGLGTGGREEDYQASERSMARRFERLDAQVDALRNYWAGEVFQNKWPIGPAPAQPGGPPLLAGAYGPKSLARVSRWCSGYVGGSAWENGKLQLMGQTRHSLTTENWLEAWQAAGREGRPRMIGQAWYTLADDGPRVMKAFGDRYFSTKDSTKFVFSPEMAPNVDADHVNRAIDEFAAAGFDELVLLPVSARLLEIERLRDIVEKRGIGQIHRVGDQS